VVNAWYRVPEWELLVHTPAVFVRVTTKGVAGYGTWKNIRKIREGPNGNGGVGESAGQGKREVLG
jgi:hypothetical protein